MVFDLDQVVVPLDKNRMSNTPLFRRAANDKCQTKWLGEIVLIQPMSFWFLAAVASCMALIIAVFLVKGVYTKRATVSGQLTPDIGVLKVYSSQPGVIVRKSVREGARVKKGDVLYIVSSERQTNSAAGIQATVSHQVALRQQSLRDEIEHTLRLQQDEENALRKKIKGLVAEQSNIFQQIAGQQGRVELADAGLKRALALLAQGYVSAEMAQQRQADLLDQRMAFPKFHGHFR